MIVYLKLSRLLEMRYLKCCFILYDSETLYYRLCRVDMLINRVLKICCCVSAAVVEEEQNNTDL